MKNKNFIYLRLLIITIIFSVTGCIGNKTIATFNNNKIYLNDAIKEYNNLDAEKKKKISSKDESFWFVRRMALEKIILDKAEKENFGKNKETLDKIEKAKKNISFEILKKKNVTDKVAVADIDYKKYDKSYKLYQIVKRTDILDEKKVDESRRFLNNISAGIKDLQTFKDYAKKYSDDETSKDGGLVGNIRMGIMEENIDNVIKNLGVNKISNIVESSAGVHLFYIESIDTVPVSELKKDKDLYTLLYNEKKEMAEEKWYDKLINDPSMKFNEELLKQKVLDDKIVIQYKTTKITRKDFFNIVDQYRQGYFPEATFNDLIKLMKKIGLDIILEDKSSSFNIVNSSDFKKRMDKEKEFIIISDYIEKHLSVNPVNDDAIKDFYSKNKNTLFTFKQSNGKLYVQPVNEVINFITQKLQEKNVQDARYNLYKKLVEEAKFKIDDKVLDEFIKSIGK